MQSLEESGDITRILQLWPSDRASALEALTPIVYAELRRIAGSYLRRQRPGHTLQPTALIHEAWMRLVKQDGANIEDRSHFYALAARIMRQILVDAARSYGAEKRGSGNKVPFEEGMHAAKGAEVWEFLALHLALEKLTVHNARLAQAIELKFFGGLRLEEIASELEISLATVKRDITLGEAWLKRALAEAETGRTVT